MEQIGQFFVMLYIGDDNYIPLKDDDDDEIAKFDTLGDAMFAGESNPLGEAYGFEVFTIGTGDFFPSSI